MGFHQHKHSHQAQDEKIGDGLQHALFIQPGMETAEGVPGRQPLVLFGVALGQAGRKIHNDAHLGDLRGLKAADDGQTDPPLSAHGTLAVAEGKHQHQQNDGDTQHKDRQAPEGLIVDLGDQKHGHQAHRAESGLLDKIVGRVKALVHGGGVGGGEYRQHADGGQDDHQHQKRDVDGTPGQLLHHRQVSPAFYHVLSPPVSRCKGFSDT